MLLRILSEDGHWVKAKPGKRMSILLHPSDREKFINWGKKKPKRKCVREESGTGESLLPHMHDEVTIKAKLNEVHFQIYSGWKFYPNLPSCCKANGPANKGEITIELFNGNWYVTDVYSNCKGYGHILYDLAIEYATEQGKGASPHTALRHPFGKDSAASERIWKYYFEHRQDVSHTEQSGDRPWLYARYSKQPVLLSRLRDAGLLTN